MFAILLPLACALFASPPSGANDGALSAASEWLPYAHEEGARVGAPVQAQFFLQPINADGSSVFRIGTTVAVKFKLTGTSAGRSNVTAFFSSTKISNTVTGSVNEAFDKEHAPDSGDSFNYFASQDEYIFRWGTKGLSKGTYRLTIAVAGDPDGHLVEISLRP